MNIIICILSGIMLSLAFPGANLHWVAWFALAPFFYSIYHSTWKQTLICGLAFGVAFFLCLIYWMSIFGALPWIALSIFQGLFILGFVICAKLIGNRLGYWGRLILLPALWVIFEWIRSLGILGFTWGDMGYSQYRAPLVIQLASVTGVWGISFLLILCNSALANLITELKSSRSARKALPQLTAALILAVGALIFGVISLRTPNLHMGRMIRAAVVQGNVSQDTNSWVDYSDKAWSRYGELTRSVGGRSNLVVWPETVSPGVLGTNLYQQMKMRSLADSCRSTLLVGGWDEQPGGKALNSAFLVKPGMGIVDRSAKTHLVPFGEFVPARNYLPFLRYYRVRSCDTSPGDGYKVMEVGGYTVGTAVCFESAFPCIARQLTSSGAQVLCVITDDEWFGRSPAAEQHFAMSVLRAVENKRYVLRAAATGISGIIAPDGSTLDRIELGNAGVLRAAIRPNSKQTFYTKHGDWVIWTSGILILVLLLVLLLLLEKRVAE